MRSDKAGPVRKTFGRCSLPLARRGASGILGGTLVDTPSGPRAIEALHPGDAVLTDDGDQVALVRWTHRWNPHQSPCPAQPQAHISAGCRFVRLRANALGPSLPRRDLIVTPDHGLIVDGWFVNAGALINGTTIALVAPGGLPAGGMFHQIETREHMLITANGIRAETFLNAHIRPDFDNHAGYLALYGADHRIAEMPRPRLTTAHKLPKAVRDRLATLPRDRGNRRRLA